MKNITCCFTGHRPNKLYGYNLSGRRYQRLANEIRKSCVYLIENKDVKIFITGGALGVDTISFFTVEYLKRKYPNIKNILAVPFRGQQNAWKSKVDLDRYDRMLKLADKVIYVEDIDEYRGSGVAQKLIRRDHYMVDNSNHIIAVHDGTTGGTYNCLTYATRVNLETIIKINPNDLI